MLAPGGGFVSLLQLLCTNTRLMHIIIVGSSYHGYCVGTTLILSLGRLHIIIIIGCDVFISNCSPQYGAV